MKKSPIFYFLLFFIFQLQAADYYWVGGTGNWSDINHWATSSGGSTKHSIVPGIGDDVYFDTNSGLLDTSIVDFPAGNAFCRNMSWAGVTTTPLFRNNSNFTLYIAGNFELSPTVRYAMQSVEFTGSGDATYRTNGAARVNAVGWYNPFTVNKIGGSLTVLDAIPEDLQVRNIILTNGHLDLSNNNHSIHSFNGNNNNVRSLDISNSQLTLTGTWDFRGTNSTLTSDGSYISALQFHSDGHSFPKVDLNRVNSNDMVINNTEFGELTFTSTEGAPGTLRIGGNNTIHRLEFKSNGLLRAGGNTIDELIIAPGFDLMVFGTNTITTSLQLNTPDCSGLGSLTGNTNGTLNFLAGATTDLNNVYIQEMTATGGITLPIDVTGADGGGNTGWSFQTPATGTTLYWVGGAGDWNEKNHWSATSGGAGGYCVPFLADDVVFDQNSGFSAGNNTVTTSSNTWCHNMTWGNVTNAPTFNSSSSYKMEVWGSLVMNNTVTMNTKLQFSGEEAATIQTNGSALGEFDVRIQKSVATGGLTLLDDFTNPLTDLELSTGQWLMPGRTLNINSFESGGGQRTIDITNATIFINYWSLTGSGRTWVGDAAGSFLTVNERFIVRGLQYPKVLCTTDQNWMDIANTTFGELIFNNPSPTSLVALASGNTIETLEFKGSGSIGYGNIINNFSLAPSMKYFFTGTNTINGHLQFNSPSCEGLGEMRGLNGIAATLDFGPASTLDIDNVYLQDMTATGNGVPITVNGADAGGNTGFNITTSTGGARYWVGGAGDWNDSSHWSDTSGGPGGACVPTVDNDVYFDANSFLGGGSTVTVSNGNAYCRNMDWTGATNNPVFTKDPLLDMEIWGNLVMNPLVSMTTNNRLLFVGTSNTTITTNGSTLGDFDFKIKKTSASATVKVLDDMSNPLTRIELERGGLDLSGTTVNIEAISDINTSFATSININNAKLALAWSYTGSQKSLTATASEITAVYFHANGGAYNKVDIQTITSNRIAVANSTFSEIVFSNASASSAAHISGGNTIDILEFKGKGNINGTGNTFGTLIFAPGREYTLLAGSTNTITGDWFGSGTPCNLTEIASSSPGVNATITKPTGTVDFDYIRLRGITADSPTPFIAHEHSVDQGNNVNWDISPYNGSLPIAGLGPDLGLKNSELPYTLTTDGFFGSPLSQYEWKKDGNVIGTDEELVISEPGLYSVTVNFVDGCSISDDIVVSLVSADLSIVKTVDNTTPAIDTNVVFTLVAANSGPAVAEGVTATDLLPTGYTFVSSTLPTGTTYDGITGLWTIGNLALGAEATMTITAKVNTTGTYLNTATITSAADDPDGTNNSASVNLVPNAPALVTQPSCEVETGTIEIQALTDATYSIDEGVTFVPTNIFPDLIPGDYTLVTKIGILTSTPEIVTINEPPIIPDAPISGGNQQVCGTDPLQTLTATAIVPTGSTITWYDAPTGGNIVTIPELNTVGSIVYYAETDNGSCISKTRTAVSLSINAVPVLNIQDPAVACHPNTIDLTVPDITNGNPNALELSYFTDEAATTALSLPSAVSVSGTYYIKGTDTTTSCSVVVPVVVQFVDKPEVIIVHPDCVTTTGSINITSPIGTDFEYSIDNGLTYSGSTSFNDLVPGTYNVLAMNTTLPGCISEVNTVVINATPTTATPTVHQPGCSELTGTVEFIENPEYEYAINGGAFVSDHIFALVPGTYSIESRKAGAPCVATPVDVIINPAPIRPAAPTATDQQVCQTGAIQILTATATVDPGSNLTWYDAATGGNVVSSPTLSSIGSKTYYAESDNGTCTSTTRTSVTLTIVPLPILDPIADINSCGEITLPAITGSNLSGNEAYYTEPNGAGTIYNAGDTYSILGGTTLYAFDKTTVGSPALSCPTEISFKVIVNPEITLNTISSDQEVCIGTQPLEIQGSTPIGGNGSYTYTWEQSVDNGISWSIASGYSTETILDPDPLIQETLFRRTVSSGGCTSISNSITMTIINFPIGHDAVVTNMNCTGTLAYDLQANVNDIANGGNGITGTFAWTAMPNPNIVGASDGMGSILSQTLINTSTTVQQQEYLVEGSDMAALCRSQFLITVNVPVCGSLTLDKTADVSSVDTAGDVINYTITVTNTGNAIHSNVVVNDPLLGGNLTDKTGDNGNNWLEAGEVWVYSGIYTVTQTDLDNNGNPVGSGMIHNTASVVTDQITTPITATNEVPIVVNPGIALIKIAEISGRGSVGDVITYTFTALNTGNVTLSDVVIDDILTNTIDLAVTPSTLAPGETGTASAIYIITQADITAGNVTNSALIKGNDPNGNEVGDISGTDIDNDDSTIKTVPKKNPEAFDDSAETSIGQPLDIDIINNDIAYDTNLVPESIEVIDGPSHGTISVDSNGKVVYTPILGTKFTGEDTFTYRVQDGNGSWTNVATVTINITGLFLPNAITPNGDGDNDTFKIVGIENYNKAVVIIYNRWGNEVYNNPNYDNDFAGKGLNDGTYYYIINLTDKQGDTQNIKGWLFIRK